MKKAVILTALLVAVYAPSAFATAELKLSSGGSSVDIVDGGAGDASATAGVVTFIGTVGNWTLNVTTGSEGSTPFFDLGSVNSTGGEPQLNPIVMSFSDDGLTLPSGFTLTAGGTVSSAATTTVTFSAFTGSSKFDTTHQIGSTLTFHTSPPPISNAYSGSTNGLVVSGDTSATLVASIDLGSPTAFGGGSFDAALDTITTVGGTPEPASISMLGGVLLILGGALRRKIKKA